MVFFAVKNQCKAVGDCLYQFLQNSKKNIKKECSNHKKKLSSEMKHDLDMNLLEIQNNGKKILQQMDGHYQQYKLKLDNVHQLCKKRVKESGEKMIKKMSKEVSKNVIDKLANGTNFSAMKTDVKDAIFSSLVWNWDDMERAKTKIMARLQKSVIKRLENGDLKHWKQKILQELKNDGKVCPKK